MDLYNKSLFSRQIGAIGKNSMQKLLNLNVMLIGSDHIAVEFAKCVALLGVNKIALLSVTPNKRKSYGLKHYHVSGNGKNNIDNIVNLVGTLNKNLECKVKEIVNNKYVYTNIEKLLSIEDINILVYTDIITNVNVLDIEKVCYDNNIRFICGFNYGLEGYVFSNFGKHTINDVDGENTQTVYIENFTINNDKVYLTVEKMHNTLISSRGIIDNLSKSIEVDVSSSSLDNIVIERNSNICDFLERNKSGNMRFIEIKSPIVKNYKLLSDYTDNPNHNIITLDSSFDISAKNIANKTLFVSNLLASSSNITKQNDMKRLEQFPILSSIIGGILGHEVIKATGKYSPLDQDIYFDFNQLNPNLKTSVSDKIKSVLHKDLCKRLSELNIFMVGCGALGCEISKNLGLLDVSTKSKGLLTITDMDTIELSNLNRQFLFRNEDIGSHKSDTVKKRLLDYFPKMKVKSFTHEVGKTTENIFNQPFWKNNDIVINALDNYEARRYVDGRCVLFDKPLFESGTLGSKCNTQTIIPYKTATYSEIVDIDDKSIPMCTIKSFPNKLEHCVEWSIETFDRIITQPLVDLNSMINTRKALIEELSELGDSLRLERSTLLLLYIELYRKKSFKSYLEFCDKLYLQFFKNPIKDVLHSFPEDLTDEYGNRFWSGKKIKPSVIGFKDIGCKEFVKCMHSILLMSIDIENWNDNQFNKYFGQDYVELGADYKQNKINIDEEKDEISIDNTDITNQADIAFQNVCKIVFKKKKSIDTIKYDKDDVSLLDLMTSLSNMRAKIYNIPEGDSQEVKMISGRIIPALSTTTTIISGFVVIEMLKYLLNIKSSDININLGTNSYVLFDSQKPSVTYNNMLSPIYSMKIKTIPENFNTWTKINISMRKDDCLTIKSLISILKNDYKIIPMSLNVGKYVIYQNIDNFSENTHLCDVFKKLNKPLSEILEINLCKFTDEGIPVLTPPVILSY